MVDYLKFLLKSSNEHSVHSPFVFSLVTNCFYDKTQYTDYQKIKNFSLEKFSVKQKKFLYRLCNYFSFRTAFFVEENQSFELFFQQFCHLEKSTQKTDFLLVSNFRSVEIQTLLQQMHNDSLLLVVKPYQTIQSKLFWEEVIENESFTATIDVFDFGLAFIRKEQQKQQFFIRL